MFCQRYVRVRVDLPSFLGTQSSPSMNFLSWITRKSGNEAILVDLQKYDNVKVKKKVNKPNKMIIWQWVMCIISTSKALLLCNKNTYVIRYVTNTDNLVSFISFIPRRLSHRLEYFSFRTISWSWNSSNYFMARALRVRFHYNTHESRCVAQSAACVVR